MAENKKKRRQPNGSGSFRKRADGTVEYRASYGYGMSGKLIRKSFYGRTQTECRQKKKEYDIAQAVPIEKIYTVSEWARQWSVLYKKDKCSESMYRQYGHIIEKYINPGIGKLKLSAVKPAHILEMMNKYADKSESFIKKIMIVLRGIFETAIDNEYCAKNPAKNVKPEYKKSKPKEFFSEMEIEAIEKFCFAERSNISDALVTLLHTGLRREELLGLKYSDVDFVSETIAVDRVVVIENGGKKIKKDLKTESSRRIIPLFPKAKSIIETKPKISEYIFPIRSGKFQSPNGFSAAYARLLKRINRSNSADNQIRELSPHCCRHTFASRLSNKGVDTKIIQVILGHADISMTGNIYTHSTIEGIKNSLKSLDFF